MGSRGPVPRCASWVLETVSNASAHLVGANTYARWARFWPTAPGPFAKPMNDIPKVVFSDSLESANWPRDDDRLRRPDRSGHATQAGADQRVPARSGRCTVRPIAGRE